MFTGFDSLIFRQRWCGRVIRRQSAKLSYTSLILVTTSKKFYTRFVYRLGPKVFILARGVRFSYRVPRLVRIMVITADCLSAYESSILSRVAKFQFRETRARCMGLTVNQWLDEFDPHTRSQYQCISGRVGELRRTVNPFPLGE